MTKGVFKEIIIILLLILAVILLLTVLLYDYVPLNKVIPEKVTYTATEEIKSALEEKKVSDEDTVVLTYEVTSTDLKNYQRVNEYKAGRKNPFGTVVTETPTDENTGTQNNSGTTTGTTGGTSSSATSGTTGTTTSGSAGNNSSTGTSSSTSTHYYPDKGTK